MSMTVLFLDELQVPTAFDVRLAMRFREHPDSFGYFMYETLYDLMRAGF